jgi:hypothetical protein
VIGETTGVEYIRASRMEVASSFDDFLRKFASGKLTEEPYYSAE